MSQQTFSPEILYEDVALLVINKPAGISVLADRESGESLLLLLRETFAERGETVFVVHRLDKETSGVIVFGKTEEASRGLSMQFEHRRVEKTYLALVCGAVHPLEGTIDLPIGPHPRDRTRMVVPHSGGKRSVTRYRVVETFRGFSLVELQPKTGRTHQIRVHLSAIGFPLAVDRVYGSGEGLLLSSFKKDYRPGKREEKPLIARLSLHARRLAFDHPETGTRMEFEAPLPRDFEIALKVLLKHGT
jgi:RluA family pseudouridine synthase